MALTKQGNFTKKVTDLPDRPSPTYTASDIKAHFQTPSDELKTTLNKLVDDLGANTGASNVGAKKNDGSSTNVQSVLDEKETKTTVSGINQRLTTAEGKITTLQTDVSTLDGEVDNQGKRIDNIVASAGTSNTEIIDARYDSINAKTYNTLSDRLDNTTLQLAQKVKKGDSYINLNEYGAIGDGVADDTQAFLNALTVAKTKKMKLFAPDKYLIKQSITIENDSIPEIIGKNQRNSQLIFDHLSGFALTVNTYYDRAFRLKNITVKQADKTKTLNGLKIEYVGDWGGCIQTENACITDFTGVVLNMVNAYNCHFKDTQINGGQQNSNNVATLLKIQYTPPTLFSNMNAFENCIFGWGHIGIQNLGGIRYSFNGCTFTGLDLFLHAPSVSGIDASRIDFIDCWFETITKGILNADINESTLTPISPVSNKLDLKNMNFINNNQSFTPTYILDSTIEPNDYANSQYFLVNGWRVNLTSNLPTFTDVSLANGWTGTLKFFKVGRFVTLYGKITPGTQTALTPIAALPSTATPYASMVIPLEESPIGNSGTRLYLASNGVLTVPADQANVFNSAYTYNFQIMFLAD